VFVAEQGVPAALEVDEADASADHFLLYDGPAPVGAARLVVEPPGFAGADLVLGPVAHLGRLAVLRTARGGGAGRRLVDAVENHARERGLRDMVLAAQTSALGFYARLGYEAYGEVFYDAGLPHRWMRRRL
jgi:predicted GNAT family N-acyltransferase